MRAPAFLTRRCGLPDHLADGDQALQVQPVVPGQVEAPVAIRQPGLGQLAGDRAGPLQPAGDPGPVAGTPLRMCRILTKVIHCSGAISNVEQAKQSPRTCWSTRPCDAYVRESGRNHLAALP